MTLAEAILVVLMKMPMHRTERDEPVEERRARLAIPAAAIAEAVRVRPAGVDEVEWAAALLAQGKAESDFAKYIAEGRCHEGPPGARCDADRHGVARARGYWQQWKVACKEIWSVPADSAEAVQEGARCAAKLLTAGFVDCRRHGQDGWQGAFVRGGGHVTCVGPRGVKRDASRRSLAAQLRKELLKPATIEVASEP